MRMKRLVSLGIIIVLASPFAKANGGKEFTTSVIYGTLAGTLVGAATLAFTTNPGDNLNNVARGASYGLYAGILLGIYVTYGVNDNPQPGSTTETIQPDQNIYEGTPPPANPAPENNPAPNGQQPQGALPKWHPTFALFPVIPANPGHLNEWGIGATLLNLQF